MPIVWKTSLSRSSLCLFPPNTPLYTITFPTFVYPADSSTPSVSEYIFQIPYQPTLDHNSNHFKKMTPSETHALQPPNSASPISRSPPDLLPHEWPAAPNLPLAVAPTEGLYVVGKTVTDRLVRHAAKDDQNKDEDESDIKPKEKDEKYLPIHPALLLKEDFDPPLPIEDGATELSPPKASSSFKAWEQSTLDRIKRAKQQRLEKGKYSVEAVEVWYQATMSRYRQERERRVVKMGKLGDEARGL